MLWFRVAEKREGMGGGETMREEKVKGGRSGMMWKERCVALACYNLGMPTSGRGEKWTDLVTCGIEKLRRTPQSSWCAAA